MIVSHRLDATLLCRDDIGLRDLLQRINGSVILAQVVVDAEGRLVGVVTDGDVRRSLLRGATMEASVADVMNASPVVGRAGAGPQNERLIAQTRSTVPFLPIVDGEGRLVDILSSGRKEDSFAAMVMAGGLGSRLGDRTKTKPKPLLHVSGKPILEHVLQCLERAQVRSVYVSVNYLAEQIEEFVAQRSNTADIEIVRETHRLGTAGPLGLIPAHEQRPVIVMNGDLVSSVDIAALMDFYIRQDLEALVAAAIHKTQIPYGVIRQDEAGLFQSIDEKPVLNHFVAAGIYVIGPALRSAIAKGQHLDMPELLNRGRALGLRMGLFPVHEYWRDVGHPADLEAANTERAAP